MNEVRFTLTENARLAPNVYRLRLAGDASAITAPGQFLELSIPGFFLRRPLSVCDWEDGSVTILYRAVGDGTRALAEMKPGQTIDALCGLGNGFDVTACGEKTLVIGGGIGVPPMLMTAKRLKNASAILGFRTADAVLLEEEFLAACESVHIATDDGSAGFHGFVPALFEKRMREGAGYTSVFACGPKAMLAAVAKSAVAAGLPCQVSMEERMGCGVGACLVCACQIGGHHKHVCKDGPVFDARDVDEFFPKEAGV